VIQKKLNLCAVQENVSTTQKSCIDDVCLDSTAI